MHTDPPNPSARTSRPREPPQTTNYYAYHDPNSTANLSTTVAHALADVMGVDVTNTEFSLYDSIDPDALDRIFSPLGNGTPRSIGHVAFTNEGFRVTVYSSGHIVITPPSPIQ